jgi:hypothetical protein
MEQSTIESKLSEPGLLSCSDGMLHANGALSLDDSEETVADSKNFPHLDRVATPMYCTRERRAAPALP